MQSINYLEEIFTSAEIWGLGGPLVIVVIGALISKKDREYGILYLLIVLLGTFHYGTLAQSNPYFYWHVLITLFGGCFVCIWPILGRK